MSNIWDDVLVTALEGGIQTWAYVEEQEKTADYDYRYAKIRLHDEFSEAEEPNTFTLVPHMLRMATRDLLADPELGGIQNGYQLAALAGLQGNDPNTDYDAITADLIVQWLCFGEVIYS